jgi:hypothetical protein
MTTDLSTARAVTASTTHAQIVEIPLADRGLTLITTRDERGALVPRELRDDRGVVLDEAAAIAAFGGASYSHALDRAMTSADTTLDQAIAFDVTDAGWALDSTAP